MNARYIGGEHLLPLVRRQRTGFREDVLGDGELADIVQQCGDLDSLPIALGQIELLREHGRVILHALDVPAPTLVFRLDGAREHFGALAM